LRINIEQEGISHRRYVVSVGYKETYIIRKELLISRYKLLKFESREKVGEIKNEFLADNRNADIILPSGTYKFEQKSDYKMYFNCKSTSKPFKEYEFIGNKGFTGSIYLNKKQIGEWDKNQYMKFENDTYDLDVDFDVDVLLLASVMVLIDIYRISIRFGGYFGWEVGNIGLELGNMNPDWKPKVKSKGK
jgi:hypothetical protein